MPYMRLGILAACTCAIGCGSPADPVALPNPVPIVVSVEPAVLVATGAVTPVTVHGLGFVEGAEVLFHGVARPTTIMDGTTVTALLPDQDLASVGTRGIRVTNPAPGGGASNMIDVTVGYPSPRLDSIAPTSADAVVTSSIVLTVRGSRFATGPQFPTIRWSGTALATTVVGATELRAIVDDFLLRSGGIVAITVSNPTPGGGTSGPREFLLRNPVPTLTSSTPGGVRVGMGDSLTLHGTGFASGATVVYNGTTLGSGAASGTTLSVVVPAEPSIRGDTISVQVTNPGPGGGTSNAIGVPVWERVPSLDALSIRWAYVDAAPFVLRLEGQQFAPDAALTWNGATHPVTYVSPERLDVPVGGSEVASVGAVPLVVINPRGGGPSAPTTFTVLEPFPAASVQVVTEVWGGLELALSRLDGTQRQVFAMADGASRPDPSPLGGIVVFERSMVEGVDRASRLFVLDLSDASERRLLGSGASALLDYEEMPRFSADGRWIYFGGRERATQRWVAWRVRPNGTQAGPVSTQFPASGADSHQLLPSPSSAGDRLVYSNYDGMLNVFDLGSRQITPLDVFGAGSRWSPSDDWIAYDNGGGRLMLIRPDGSDVYEPAPGAEFGPSFDWLGDDVHIVGTTDDGVGVLVNVNVGVLDSLSALGSIGSIAWSSNP